MIHIGAKEPPLSFLTPPPPEIRRRVTSMSTQRERIGSDEANGLYIRVSINNSEGRIVSLNRSGLET